MSKFFKMYWKWIALGTTAIVLVVIAVVLIRTLVFVDAISGVRNSDAPPTAVVNAPATATAVAIQNALGIPTTTPNAVAASPTATPPPNSKTIDLIKAGQPVSVLVLGYGGFNHEGQYLTDTILVLRYDPKTKTMSQFNIPRDLIVFAPSGGTDKGDWRKVNSIFSYIMEWSQPNQDSLAPIYRWKDDKGKLGAAANLTANSVQSVLGFPINEWMTVSFKGFRDLIDKMDGVEVNVDTAFVDEKYPKNDNDKVDASYITIKFAAGLQKMNGERAIQYARSRNSQSLEGGDFARSKRQMKVINAVKDKVFKNNLVTNAFGYMDALQNEIHFSTDGGELLALANYFNSDDGKRLASDTKFSSEVMDNSKVQEVQDYPVYGYALLPKAGRGNYQALQADVQRAINNCDIRREGVRVQVLNGNGTPGIAAKFSDYLVLNGFRISEEQDGQNSPESVLYDYSDGKATNTIARLKSYVPSLVVKAVPSAQKPTDTPSDLVLLLGKNYNGVSAKP